jgi:hypothetical protein
MRAKPGRCRAEDYRTRGETLVDAHGRFLLLHRQAGFFGGLLLRFFKSIRRGTFDFLSLLSYRRRAHRILSAARHLRSAGQTQHPLNEIPAFFP